MEDPSDSNLNVELVDALKTYTCLIDIHSVTMFNEGWIIYGDKEKYRGPHKGRVISMVGEYNSGKTWLMGHLMDVVSPDSVRVNTPGLGIILPVDAPTVEAVKTPLTPVNPRSRAAKLHLSPNTIVAEKIIEYIILDSQGTDKANRFDVKKDVRATELFIRDVQLAIADRFIFVCHKFNATQQDKVSELIAQLSHHPKKLISTSNRLIVVHNLRDVMDEETLGYCIRETSICYIGLVHDVGGGNKNEDFFRGAEEKLSIDGESVTVTSYQTLYTHHIFLVHHPNTKTDQWHWKHNLASFEVLKRIFKNNTDPREFRLIEEFKEKALERLPKYIQGWNEYTGLELAIQEEHGKNSLIIPVMNGKEFETGFTLCEREFTDVWEAFSEGQLLLTGDVCTTPTEHIIILQVPGVFDINAIKIEAQFHRHFLVEVELPSLIPDTSSISVEWTRKEIRSGKAQFKHKFPKTQAFENLTKVTSKEVTLANGVLVVKLKRENQE